MDVSLATAVRVREPLDTPVVSQEVEYGGEVTSLERLLPSSLNWTPATAVLSEAEAETVTDPETVEFEVGDVIETEGGVVSEGGGTEALFEKFSPYHPSCQATRKVLEVP